MSRILCLAALATIGCATQPPSRAVLELYMAVDGETRCAEQKGDRWTVAPRCCPAGFAPVGFSVPAATAYLSPSDEALKYKYRHVVCLEEPPA